MRRLNIAIYIGPNLYSRLPLARLEVDGEGAAPLSARELTTRLQHIWPEGRHWPAIGKTVSQCAEARGSLDWPQAIGLVANFAQSMTPQPKLRYWHESLADDAGDGGNSCAAIVVEAKLPLVGKASVLFAFDVVQSIFSETALQESERLKAGLQRSLSQLAQRRSGKIYNNITGLLVDSALARGVPVSQYFSDSPTAVMGQGRHRIRMVECFGDSTSVIAYTIARDKSFTASLLADIGVPVPKQRVVRNRTELERAVREIGFPLVIKGRTGSKGDSVTTNIRSKEEIEAALKKVRDLRQEVIVERHIDGDDYRLTVIDGKLVAAARRVPAHVVGDGEQTIAELIAEENRRRANWDSPYATFIQHLVLDDDMRTVLARQDLTAESVPAEGTYVPLRTAGNFSLGGLAEDVTDEIHPTVVAVMERAARTLGLDMAGVDLLSPDITKPIDSVRCAVNEVNNFPSPRAHYITPTPPRDVAGAIIDYLFADERRGRIPCVALLSQQASAIAALMRRVFGAAGLTAGSASRDGLYLDQEKLSDARDLGPSDTATILQDPVVEAAILEISPAQLLRQGLAWDACDSAFIDMTALDPTTDADRLAEVIASLADKALVLDATSQACRRLAEKRTRQRIVWVAAGGARGIALPPLAQGDRILSLEADASSATLNGGAEGNGVTFHLTKTPERASVQGAALSALALALSLDLDHAAIKAGLRLPETVSEAPQHAN